VLPAEARRAPGAPLIAARALILATLGLALAAAGCGDEDDEAPPSVNSGAATEIEVTLDPDGPEGSEEPQTKSVSCEPGDGSACARLEATDLAPLDPATPCTEIYGGPDEVTVEGTIGGEEVTATLTRVNGCEIDRFESMLPLLEELFPGYEPGGAIAP
jgi:hypothetical protein